VRRRFFGAIIGATLVALSLCGSARRSIDSKPASSTEIALYTQGRQLYERGEYSRATEAFRSAALQAERDNSARQAAMNWNNAGGAALARMDFRDALPAFEKARDTARQTGQLAPLLMTLNNLADLYLEMGDYPASMQAVHEGLAYAGDKPDPSTIAKLHFHLATALARQHRFDLAKPVYWQAIDEMNNAGSGPAELDAASRMLGNFGFECLQAGDLDTAEMVLAEGLRIVRTHRLNAAGNILRVLGRLRARQGDRRAAAALFNAALDAPAGMTPRWLIYADRGDFRLANKDFAGALKDFRQARAIASQLRADVVPADHDRISLSSGLDRIPAGLVEAGNRLAQKTGDPELMRETFDAAEQDREWSLRAIVPSASDWRTKLPAEYWDRLARYQSLQRALMAKPSAALISEVADADRQLDALEASAANAGGHPLRYESGFDHVRSILRPDTVLFSFHVEASAGWLWVMDSRGLDVVEIPCASELKSSISRFSAALRGQNPDAERLGAALYRELFERVPSGYLSHPRWLLELDGPLFDLPFGALVVRLPQSRRARPEYLVQKATLEAVPGALLINAPAPFLQGGFLGIGDPVYNMADDRYRGARGQPGVSLARLPSTAGELDACARAWNSSSRRILTGNSATLDSVRAGLRSNAAIIHFATHVVTDASAYSAGQIALSLDAAGRMGLMGPAEIIATPIKASLVVLNGCHSGRGERVAGAGLMGLTRAWIGAGARAVLATQWDIPDANGQSIMADFYNQLRQTPSRGPAYALQQAQLRAINNRGDAAASPAAWSAYFVTGRE